jgi:hypothetical protein
MSKSRPCPDCGNNFIMSEERCPHCGRPGLYPNVYAAGDADEVAALENRYETAKREAEARGAAPAVEHFETNVANARAVIGRPDGEVQRLITSDNQLYATYYKLVGSGIRLPGEEKWDTLRRVADDALFAGYKEHIRFAALSLDGVGPINYGDCFLVLRTDMIAHRASVFEENSVLFMAHHDIKMKDAHKLPRGFKATWDGRAKLCVAKLAARIDAATSPAAYSDLLLRQGSTTGEDDFVEVHIWGPMTIRTVEEVIPNPRLRRPPRAVNRANKERLKKFGVMVR